MCQIETIHGQNFSVCTCDWDDAADGERCHEGIVHELKKLTAQEVAAFMAVVPDEETYFDVVNKETQPPAFSRIDGIGSDVAIQILAEYVDTKEISGHNSEVSPVYE